MPEWLNGRNIAVTVGALAVVGFVIAVGVSNYNQGYDRGQWDMCRSLIYDLNLTPKQVNDDLQSNQGRDLPLTIPGECVKIVSERFANGGQPDAP